MWPLQLINVLGGAYVTVGRKRDHSTEAKSVTMTTLSRMRMKSRTNKATMLEVVSFLLLKTTKTKRQRHWE